MSISKRQEQILGLIEKEGFFTVNALSQITYTSPSSIRRDLSKLESLCLIKRTHGGAVPFDEGSKAVPLVNRMLQNISEKRKIAKKASSLLTDGQIVMLDGSTTAAFMVPYIAKHKSMTLFTNNMLTAIDAINQGITTHCIGGSSVNSSAVLAGEESYRRASEIYSDIFFFSSNGLDNQGIISDPTESENYLRSLMLKNTKRSVFLCDSKKFNKKSLFALTTLNDIDVAVFDKPWNEPPHRCIII